MSMLKISVVCCDDSPEKYSRIVESELDSSQFDALVVETVEQQVAAGEEREMHNASHHAVHGPVTYLQQVNTGGFSVFVGPPGSLRETFFGAGQMVAFMDDQGPGHASKVGPDGAQRTLRVLKGHLDLP
jgi:hypothetical protein